MILQALSLSRAALCQRPQLCTIMMSDLETHAEEPGVFLYNFFILGCLLYNQTLTERIRYNHDEFDIFLCNFRIISEAFAW